MNPRSKTLIETAYALGLIAACALALGHDTRAAGFGLAATLTAALSGWYEARS
jgi:hypothetical protein